MMTFTYLKNNELYTTFVLYIKNLNKCKGIIKLLHILYTDWINIVKITAYITTRIKLLSLFIFMLFFFNRNGLIENINYLIIFLMCW